MIQKGVIFSWLEQFGSKPDYGKAEVVEWFISGKFKDIPFVVVRPNSDDRVVIQRGLITDQAVLEKIKKSAKSKRKDYVFSLKRDLLIRGVRYQMNFEDESETILQSLLLETFVYEDSITKNEFFREFNSITDATYLYLATTKHFFQV